jgi:hypothetical protein
MKRLTRLLLIAAAAVAAATWAAVAQASQQGISTAAWHTAIHTNSTVDGGAVLAGGSLFSGMMSHRKPTVTYVWGVPNLESTNVVHATSPSFSVNYVTCPAYSPTPKSARRVIEAAKK